MNIIIDKGDFDCPGQTITERVEATDMGTPGPWIKVTCKSCSMHWYAHAIAEKS